MNHGSEYARVTPGSICEYAWICLIVSGKSQYARICVNMPEICLNGFCFIFPHCNSLSVWKRGYLFQCLHQTRSFSLKENKAVFLEPQNSIIIIFFFFFWGGGGRGGGWGGRTGVKGVWLGVGVQPVNRDISYFSLILLRHNVDEKKLRKIDAKIDVNQGLQEIWCRTTQILVLKRQLRSS